MLAGDHAAIVNYQTLGKTARLAVPTNEHFLPLLYVMALQSETTTPRFFNEQLVAGSLSMRSVWID
jgi:4,5-DOPA dioxygenase extradiol